MQRVSSAATRAILPLLFSVFGTLFFILPTFAADVCCKCKPANTSTYTCLTDPNFNCSEIVAGSQNTAITGYTCEDATSVQCAAVSSNGVCTVGPSAAKTFIPVASGTAGTIDAVVPKLNVPIPGLTFSSTIVVQERDGLRFLYIPFLAEYVNAVYQYLLGIIVLAAAVMIVYGGFKYIMASTISGVKDGKEIVRDAIIGLLLAFGAYTMLRAINPATVSMKALEVEFIPQESFHLEGIKPTDYWKSVSQSPGAPSIPPALLDPNAPPPPPGTKVMDGTCELEINQAKIATVESSYRCGIQVAKDVGIPPCYAVVAINHESFQVLPTVGHDENVTGNYGKNKGLIDARIAFLKYGTTYLGKSVPPAVVNDDKFDPDKADGGLDKRFSHGGGLMGMTIACAPTIGGKGRKCYTIHEKNQIYKGIEGPMLLVAEMIRQAGGNGTDPAVVKKAWVQYRGVDPVGRANETLECFKLKDPIEAIKYAKYTPFNVCRGDFPLEPAACESAAAAMRARGLPIPDNACKPMLNCADSRLPIKKEGGVLKIRR